MMSKLRTSPLKKIFPVLVFQLLWLISWAQPAIPQAEDDKYIRREVMIPMRDGVKLHTIIYSPKNQKENLPFLMQRSPYGVWRRPSPEKNAYVKDMADDGYIFVYQDIRGRYGSEGKYEMLRFTRNKKDKKAIDESSDAFDTIDWLLKNIPMNNGRAGMYGISYDAWLATVAAADPHPALKAVSEQATTADMYLGDDFHHNGAFRLSYAFEYAFMQEAAKTDSLFPFDTYDTYEWYLRLGPLSNVNKQYFHGKMPSWNNFAAHPNYDEFWQKQALASRLDYPRVPIQHVVGWWDQEDLYGPQKTYEVLEKRDSKNQNYIVFGPWYHGGWAYGEGNTLGNISFDKPTAETFRKDIQARWFAYHLKGKGDGKFDEAVTFQTGANEWKNYSAWPPKESQKTNLYLNSEGKLSFNAPSSATSLSTSFVSDPQNPVPYRQRPVEATYSPTSRWRQWQTEDQRFVHRRPDVLSWESEVLSEDVQVTGNLLARIFAATTGTDADWVVKLIDVYPALYQKDLKMSGYQLMVSGDVIRGRFRKSFSNPEPVKPGEVEQYTIDLHGINHVFQKGHKIMVQIQSTWFPVIDRNPQRYVPNIFEASGADYQKATHSIFHSGNYPSHIELPLVKK